MSAVPGIFPDLAIPRQGLNTTKPRVAVVGGGLSGLVAAWVLNYVGLPFTVFEATNRLGGRVYTLDDFVPGAHIEAGAELIGKNHPGWWRFARRFRLQLDRITEEDEYECDPEKDECEPKQVAFGTTIGKEDKAFDFYGLDIPQDYTLAAGRLGADVHGGDDHCWLMVNGQKAATPAGGDGHDKGLDPPLDLGALFQGQTGHIPIPWAGGNFDHPTFSGTFTADVLPSVPAAWRAKTYLALYEAAQNRFNQTLERAKDRKAYLELLISKFDALTLREMEREEVMKWVLKWLFGKSWGFKQGRSRFTRMIGHLPMNSTNRCLAHRRLCRCPHGQ